MAKAQARKVKRYVKSRPPLDLFGQVSVTQADIDEWLATVGRFDDPTSPRAKRYAAAWDVAGKIAHFKARGLWPPQIIARGKRTYIPI